MNGTAKAAFAGLGATLPMTIFMSQLHKKLPIKQQYSLPPRQIMMWLSKMTGVKHKLNEEKKTTLTLLGHFTYGALTGTLIHFLSKRIPLMLRGSLVGLGVWIGSYFGILPLTKYNLSGIKMPLQRNLLMAGAHIIWGWSLAVLYRAFDSKILLSGFSRFRLSKS